MNLFAPWRNDDEHNLGLLLGSEDPANGNFTSFVEQIRDRLDEFFIPAGNYLLVTFNITDVATFQTELAAWYAASTQANIVRIASEYIQDQNGTCIYMLTYA